MCVRVCLDGIWMRVVSVCETLLCIAHRARDHKLNLLEIADGCVLFPRGFGPSRRETRRCDPGAPVDYNNLCTSTVHLERIFGGRSEEEVLLAAVADERE